MLPGERWTLCACPLEFEQSRVLQHKRNPVAFACRDRIKWKAG